MDDYLFKSEPVYDETGSYIVLSPEVNGCDETDNIFISLKAVQIIDDIREANNIPSEYKLRVSTSGGTQNGRVFLLMFDNFLDTCDRLVESGDFTLIADSRTLFFLMGVKIDFSDTDGRKGFVFDTFIRTESYELPETMNNN
jgi:Fe-S cluster assembly iron-binding protein IscA